MRTRHVFGMVAGIMMAWMMTASAQVPDWKSPVGPDGVTRVIVEAEDMKGVDGKQFGGSAPEWRVGRAGIDHYQCNVFGGHWQSRTRTAMTDKGDNSAEISADIEVPKAGKYKLWVKYECPPFFNYAMDVSLTPVGAKDPTFRQTYGLEAATKHYSFNDKPVAGSLYWTWGIDHDAAEGYAVDLPAGKVKLALAKTKNPEPAGMRSVDAIMLTDDLSDVSCPKFPRYPLLDELRRANHVFLRFRLPKDAPGKAKLTWNRWGKRYNDFYSAQYTELVRYYDAQGVLMVGTNGKPVAVNGGQIPAPLAPGESSVWLDIGPCLNTESAGTFDCRATIVDDTGKALDAQPAVVLFGVDIALAPAEAAIVKRFDVKPTEPGGAITFLLQPDLNTDEGLNWSVTLADVYRTITAELDKVPRKAPMPKKMRFYGSTGAPLGGPQQWSWEIAMDFRRAVGLNTVFGNGLELKPEDYVKQQAWCKQRGFELMRSACFHHSQDTVNIATNLKAKGTASQFYYLSYGDEIGLPNVDPNKPEIVAAFHEYLKKQNVTPETLGLSGWDKVKPLATPTADVAVQIGVVPAGQTGATVDKTVKRLYWHSCLFRIQQGIDDFAARTKKFREMLGNDVHTSANLGGMHPFYWMHQSSFIESFKHNAMTMAWTEDYDYCQPETSRLVAEYQAGYLKAGTKYNHQRMMFYCMPHYPGNSPEHLLQNAVLEMGQNVKDLDWFSIPPDGWTTENYINPRNGLPMFHALRTASDIAGMVEDWLDPAGPVATPVAMLLSEASDTWEIGGMGQWAVAPGTEYSNAFQEERKNTYFALRNAGYRVDLVTESDVREGYLKSYRALYVGGENMERATAKVIAGWVNDGGVLYMSAGAARKDEYDEPLDVLEGVVGRGKRVSYARYKGALRSKLELPLLKPLATVKTVEGAEFPALATMEKFEPVNGTVVLATYDDGKPAVVSRQTGKGMAYYTGTFPGEAWAKKALPAMPCGKGGPENNTRYPQFEPTDFDAVAASVVLRPLVDAKIQPDIRPDKPNVVCNRLAGKAGTVIMIVNLGGTQKGAVKDLTLAIDDAAKAKKVWSYAYPKDLGHEVKDGVLLVRLPEVNLVDVLVLEGVQ